MRLMTTFVARAFFAVGLAFLPAQAWAETGGPAAVALSADAPRSADVAYLADSRVSTVAVRNGALYAARIGRDGAFRNANRRGILLIQRQRRAFDVIAGGVAKGGRDGEALVAKGLSAIAWGMERSGRDGSFPEQGGRRPDGFLVRAFFVEAAARSLLLVRDADLPADFKAEARRHNAALLASATYLVGITRAAMRKDPSIGVNALFVVAAGLEETARLVDAPELSSAAREIAGTALAQQSPDGTFPERGGFDSNYQSVSLAFGARYASVLPASPWRNEVGAALARGSRRMLAVIDPQTGKIDTRDNSRTIDCAKVTDLDRGGDPDVANNLAMRLYYVALVLRSAEGGALERSAGRVQGAAQDIRTPQFCPMDR